MNSSRPTTLTPALADEICARVAFGQTLSAICRDPKMPWEVDARRWIEEDRAFAAQYDRALRYHADAEFDRLKQLADEATPNTLNVAKFKAEVTRWRLEKLDPSRFGDKAEVAVSHRLGPKITAIEVEIIEPGYFGPGPQAVEAGEVIDAEIVALPQPSAERSEAPQAAIETPDAPPVPPSFDAARGVSQRALDAIGPPRRRPRVFFR